MTMTTNSAWLAGLMLLAGCSGGGGGGNDGIKGNADRSVAPYLELDLSAGTVRVLPAAPSGYAAEGSIWRRSRILFKRVEAGTARLGSAEGSFAHDPDEQLRDVVLPASYVGVFELTQGQWRTLAGTSPWREVSPGPVIGEADPVADDDDKPAFNLAADDVVARLATYAQGRDFRLDLPSEELWEYVCRAGTVTTYSWGDSRDPAVVAQQAICQEVLGGVRGVRRVGRLVANPWGFHDLHGNLWELVRLTDGWAIRGGSWNDPLASLRSANRQRLEVSSLGHGLVGVRLVLIPR